MLLMVKYLVQPLAYPGLSLVAVIRQFGSAVFHCLVRDDSTATTKLLVAVRVKPMRELMLQMSLVVNQS